MLKETGIPNPNFPFLPCVYLHNNTRINTDTLETTLFTPFNSIGNGNSLIPSDNRVIFPNNFATDNDNPPCFDESVEILCLCDDKEVYIPIKNIKKGSLIKTYKHGFKSVALIGWNKMFNNKTHGNCMYIMKKKDNMTNDLVLTGNHSILVDQLSKAQKKQKRNKNDITIDDKYMVFVKKSDLFKKIDDSKIFTYYHLAFNDPNENVRYGIWDTIIT